MVKRFFLVVVGLVIMVLTMILLLLRVINPGIFIMLLLLGFAIAIAGVIMLWCYKPDEKRKNGEEDEDDEDEDDEDYEDDEDDEEEKIAVKNKFDMERCRRRHVSAMAEKIAPR